MDFEMLMALVFVIIVVSIVMGTVGGIVKRQTRLKERQMELEAGQRGPDTAPLLEKINTMEQRIRNLERIATDASPSLSAQIEALRLSDERAETVELTMGKDKEEAR